MTGAEAPPIGDDALPVGLAVLDADGVVRRANRTLLEWCGRAAADTVGQHLTALFVPGSRVYLLTHVVPLLRMQRAVREVALELQGPAGGVPVLLSADELDEPPGHARVLLVDVRERRRYEAELRRERERAEAALAHQSLLAAAAGRLAASLDPADTAEEVAHLAAERLADACWVYVHDAQGRRLAAKRGASSAGYAVAGLDPGAFLDLRAPLAAVADRRVPAAELQAAGAALGGHPAPDWRLAAASAPMPDGALTLAFAWTGIDPGPAEDVLRDYAGVAALALANARSHAAAQDAVKAREELMGVLAHEFGNPLAALRMQLEVWRLRNQGVAQDPSVVRTMDTVQRQLDRMARLVSDMVDLSRIRAGRLRLEVAPTDLLALAHGVVERQQAIVAARGTTLTLAARPGPAGAVVRCDALRVEQVLVNLVSNAAKYGGRSPVTVELVDAGPKVRLVVRDHGPGIPEEDRTRVFSRFERLDTTQTGAGLGLYVVEHIVQAHDGKVWVEETPGGGATFVVELPRDGPCADRLGAGAPTFQASDRGVETS